MSNETLAGQLSEFACEHSFENLPFEVIESVKKRVLDTLGICVAASSLDTSKAAMYFALDQGSKDQAHAIGIAQRIPATMAAFVNGVLAHSLDYDDTHLPSVLHPSATVVPAAIAVGELVGASGEDLIAAIACGLEVCVRIGMAGYDEQENNSIFFDNGQHATSICGALGGAVAAGMLQGFDSNGIMNTIGVVSSMASGIIESNRTGGTVKRMHCGWAANSAVSASQLVKHGFSGPPTVLEGRFGFFQAWLHGKYDSSQITGELGKRWEVPSIFFKPYPANHFTHTAIDAARAIRNRGIRPTDIKSLTLGVAEPIVRTIGEPIAVKRLPETAYMAQFSGPYAVAAGLLGGGGLGVGLDDYTDALARDPMRRSIMAKVDVVADDVCTSIFPRQFPSVLTVTLNDGSEIVERVLSNRGGSDRPLTYDEIATKFMDNASRNVSFDSAAEAKEMLMKLEQVKSVRSIFDHLNVDTL